MNVFLPAEGGENNLVRSLVSLFCTFYALRGNEHQGWRKEVQINITFMQGEDVKEFTFAIFQPTLMVHLVFMVKTGTTQ